MSASTPAMTLGSRKSVLEELRARVAALERGGGKDGERGGGRPPGGLSGAGVRAAALLGVEAIDSALPGGLLLGSMHEIAGEGGAATGFTAALLVRLARFAGGGAPVLWCLSRPELYGPGLAALGVDPARLIVAYARSRTDLLWAMEEGLRCPALAAAVAEAGNVGVKESRRLQLAAEAGGVTGFLLREGGNPGTGRSAGRSVGRSVSAATAWRVAPAPQGEEQGEEQAEDQAEEPARASPTARWRLELVRCRGGASGSWIVDWNDETGDFTLAAALPDRPHRAAPGKGEGRTGGRAG
ncbi:MAG: hypothetical protein WCF16_00850 [Alphaproteobacteria bacterium]